jgi:hypothetical protein
LAIDVSQPDAISVACARGIEWAHASVICDPGGHLLAGPVRGPALLQAGCDLSTARDKSLGPRNDVLADRRPELYATQRRPSIAKEIVN